MGVLTLSVNIPVRIRARIMTVTNIAFHPSLENLTFLIILRPPSGDNTSRTTPPFVKGMHHIFTKLLPFRNNNKKLETGADNAWVASPLKNLVMIEAQQLEAAFGCCRY